MFCRCWRIPHSGHESVYSDYADRAGLIPSHLTNRSLIIECKEVAAKTTRKELIRLKYGLAHKAVLEIEPKPRPADERWLREAVRAKKYLGNPNLAT